MERGRESVRRVTYTTCSTLFGEQIPAPSALNKYYALKQDCILISDFRHDAQVWATNRKGVPIWRDCGATLDWAAYNEVCCAGSPRMRARCPGGGRAIPTRCGSARSCCNRRPSRQ